MKHNLHLALAFLFCTTLSARAAAVSTAILGQSQNNTVSYIQTSDTSAVADLFTAEQLAAYKGAKITQVSVDMNGASDHLRVFVASSLTGEPLASQLSTSKGEGWQTITFDEPYTITGEPVYIGYEVEGIRSLRYSQALMPGREWQRRRSAGWEEYENDYRASFYATVEGDGVPTSNALIFSTTLPHYVETGHEMEFTATLSNLGSTSISSATFDVLVDGTAVATETVSGLSIAKRRKGSLTFSAGTIATEGTHELALALTHVNGVADTDLYANQTEAVSATCRSEFTPRKVLMEVYSTEKCTACPAAHERIEQSLGKETNIIEVCHHSGFLTDQLTVDESQTYEWFFGTNKYAPAVMFDRTAYVNDLPDAFYQGVPPVEPKTTSLLTSLHKLSKATPALASVDLNTTYDEQSRRLTVSVCGSQLLPVEGMENICLNVFLTEDSIFSTTQTSSNKSFWHRHALRQVLTDTWGESYELSSADVMTYETTLDDSWDASRMAVVAFIANYDGSDKTNCRVLNAAQCPVVNDPTGIAGVSDGTGAATVVGRYNAAGMPLAQPQSGLNIIRKSNGETIKVILP